MAAMSREAIPPKSRTRATAAPARTIRTPTRTTPTRSRRAWQGRRTGLDPVLREDTGRTTPAGPLALRKGQRTSGARPAVTATGSYPRQARLANGQQPPVGLSTARLHRAGNMASARRSARCGDGKRADRVHQDGCLLGALPAMRYDGPRTEDVVKVGQWQVEHHRVHQAGGRVFYECPLPECGWTHGEFPRGR